MSDEAIAGTAHYTAYVWRRLRLPWSELFATRRGAALFWSFRLAGEWAAAVMPGMPSMVDYLAGRHLAIEHALERLHPDRVVELGAGLSRRGVTWAFDRGVRYVEVDLPAVIEEKRARLAASVARAILDDTLRLEAHDVFAPSFEPWLARTLEGSARPVVVAEGLLGYFDFAARLRVAAAVRRALAPARGAFLCDLRSRDLGGASSLFVPFLRAGIRLATRGRGAAEDFASEDDVRSFFAEAGFASAEPIDPRDVPDAPRVRAPARVWRAIA